LPYRRPLIRPGHRLNPPASGPFAPGL
jgi:hypothetical protein